MESFYRAKRILVTGAAGTVGSELVRHLTAMGPEEVRLVDNNETGMFFLMEEHRNRNVYCFLGDVRDYEKLEKLSSGMDIVIHAAAFKHVILSEYNPFDVVQTNIYGVENVIRAANATGVSHVLFTSSDKAVNPTNVMGTSKLMGERLITAANTVRSGSQAIFSSTRFGNVLGSRGSVVPLFMRQIRAGGPVTVTDERMTRFIMTIEEAASLVLKSLSIARGGEVFVTKMPVVRIVDLAEVMISLLARKYGFNEKDIRIEIIGAKPGEKLYEELMSDDERHRSMELKEMFSVTPAFRGIYQNIEYEYPDTISQKTDRPYNSSTEKSLDKQEIREYLMEHQVLEKVEEAFFGGI